MNAAAVRMTFEDWGEVLRIAATIWPQSRSFFDDRPGAERTPTRTWWAALCRFGTDDVLTAIGRLGMTSRYWPSLADVVETTREVLAERLEQRRRAEELARARLHAPRQSTAPDRLAVFDQTTAAVRRERSQELRRFVAHAGGVDVGPDPLADASDGVGEWERRVRELIARGWPEADGVKADPDSASGKRDDPAAAGPVCSGGAIGANAPSDLTGETARKCTPRHGPVHG